MAHLTDGERSQLISNSYVKVVHTHNYVIFPVIDSPLLQLWSPDIANKACHSRRFIVALGLKPCLRSAQIGEAQRNSSVEVTGKRLNLNSVIKITHFLLVHRGDKLPRLKTLLGMKRPFYVTVTDGMTVKKTKAIRSVKQVVKWDEKLDCL